MSILTQYQGINVAAAVTLANAAITSVDIPRPQTTPQEVAYAEGTDHVTRPIFINEEFAGAVVIDLPASFVAANIFLSKLSIKSLLPAAQKGLQDASSAFFPTGAPTDATIVRTLYQDPNQTTPSQLATNSDSLRDLLGNLRTGATVRSFPGITLREGEFVHMEFFQSTGAPIGPAQINAVYKMGLNQADTGKP